MISVNLIGGTISGDKIKDAFTLLTKLPVNSVESFSKMRRCIAVIADSDNNILEFETEDFKFLQDQFQWALSMRQLAGNEVWEHIASIFKEREKDIK